MLILSAKPHVFVKSITRFYIIVSNAMANKTLLYLKNETYELEISEVENIIAYETLVSDQYSLKMVASPQEIIKLFLNRENIKSEINQENIYKIHLTSEKEIELIKEEILEHFLNASNLQIETSKVQEMRYELSYFTDLEPKEAEVYASENPSTILNIDLKKRVILLGYSLEDAVGKLNNALDEEVFTAGHSNLSKLPRIHFVKRKLTAKPTKYLKSKGFKIQEVEVLATQYKIVDNT
jgi:hypothetical protein